MPKKLRFILAAAVFTVLLCVMYSRFILPPALEVSKNRTVTYVNERMDEAVNRAADELGHDAGAFCTVTHDGSGQISSIAADSMAVNRFCALSAKYLSQALNSSENTVYVKLGTLTGLPLLADIGPRVRVKIRCTGGAEADYDTEVKSVGINQVSFRLFINMQAGAEAYSPLVCSSTVIKRKIMLADTVYAGKVPDTLGMGIPAEGQFFP